MSAALGVRQPASRQALPRTSRPGDGVRVALRFVDALADSGLEPLDTRDYYEQQRPGLGAVFELVAQRTLDAIEAAPDTYPNHPFAKVAGVRRALFIRLGCVTS